MRPAFATLSLAMVLAQGCRTTGNGDSEAKDTFISPIRPTADINIPNTHKLDDKFYRGMLPVSFEMMRNQLVEKAGITDILILDSRGNENVVFEMETLSEKLGFVAAGNYGNSAPFGTPTDDFTIPEFATSQRDFRRIPWSQVVPDKPRRYFYRPVPFHNLDPFSEHCRQFIDTLRVVENVHTAPNRKLYLHCTVGEDRTGAVAGLYRLLNDPNADIGQIFRSEMCERAYEAGNPDKPLAQVVVPIRRALTPFFLKMAYKIKKRQLTWDLLSERATANGTQEHPAYAVCDRDPASEPDFQNDAIYHHSPSDRPGKDLVDSPFEPYNCSTATQLR